MMSRVHNSKGFTLIELMIVVAIIGILAAIAVPNFVAYRNKARVAAGISTGESIRGAMAGFAADSNGNYFPNTAAIPADANGWDDLTTVCNQNGATLKAAMSDQGYSGMTYQGLDEEGAASATEVVDYYFVFTVSGIPAELTGSTIELRPSGIVKYTTS